MHTRNKKQYMITMLPTVMEATKEAAKKLGMSVSQFIEITMKANCQLTGPVQDLMRGLFTDLLEVDRTVTPVQKKEIMGLFDEEPKKKAITGGKKVKASGRAVKRK